MSEVLLFGERAARRARLYRASEKTLLVVSADGAVDAIRKAVELREDGIRFGVAFILDDQRTAQAAILGKELLRFSQDFDQRRNAFELLARNQLQINGKPQSDVGALPLPVAKTLRDVAALADEFVVHSWAEYRRICGLLGVRRPARRTVVLDPCVPSVTPDKNADAIVVWAPDETADSLGVVLFGLAELRRPSYVVCRPGATYGLRTSLVPLSECERVLARARVILDGSVDTPSAALTFLSRGVRAIASSTTGAVEYAPSIRFYDPTVRRSIFAAVVAALGEPPAAVHLDSPPHAPASISVAERAPAVSIIVRTFERPLFLRRALRSIEAQTYPNFEAIVVNNGGDAAVVEEICRPFACAHLTRIEPTNIALAATTGLERGSGKYAALLDDDDELFPDHVERLCGALERAGTLAAYADAMNIYLRPVLKNFAVTGFLGVFVPALEPATMAVTCQVIGSSRIMFDRRWALAAGGFRPEFFPADDYEMWLRILQSDDVVRVAAVTSLYSQFANRANTSVAHGAAYAEAHRRIYAAYPASPALERSRERMIAELERLGGHGMAQASVTFDTQKLLFPQ
jgi:hypothetical protein